MLKVMVSVNHLEKGMYVSELDRPWLDSPFIFQGFRITNHDEIRLLKDTCEYVYIDKEKSIIRIPQHAIYQSSVSKPKQKNKFVIRPQLPYTNTFDEEIPQARKTYTQASRQLKQMLSDARLGSSLDSNEVKSQVNHLADSVIRHPDALMLLSSMKNKGNFVVYHALNVCVLSMIFARYLGMEEDQLKELGIGALLHDIGETLVPDEILCKAGERTAAENKIRQSHTTNGAAMLEKLDGVPRSAVNIARNHHERADGSGYPNKLRNHDLDTFTKIVILADVYDMATSGLYGNPAVTSSAALKKIYELRERFFDATLVERFIQSLGIYPIGSVIQFRSGELGIVISAEPKTRLYPKVLLIRDRNQHTLLTPKVINLALFHEKGIKDRYKISRVVKPEAYNIDVGNYIINELQHSLMAAASA